MAQQGRQIGCDTFKAIDNELRKTREPYPFPVLAISNGIKQPDGCALDKVLNDPHQDVYAMTPEEESHFRKIFSQLKKEENGLITNATASKILWQYGISLAVLQRILDTADAATKDNMLDLSEFLLAMRLCLSFKKKGKEEFSSPSGYLSSKQLDGDRDVNDTDRNLHSLLSHMKAEDEYWLSCLSRDVKALKEGLRSENKGLNSLDGGQIEVGIYSSKDLRHVLKQVKNALSEKILECSTRLQTSTKEHLRILHENNSPERREWDTFAESEPLKSDVAVLLCSELSRMHQKNGGLRKKNAALRNEISSFYNTVKRETTSCHAASKQGKQVIRPDSSTSCFVNSVDDKSILTGAKYVLQEKESTAVKGAVLSAQNSSNRAMIDTEEQPIYRKAPDGNSMDPATFVSVPCTQESPRTDKKIEMCQNRKSSVTIADENEIQKCDDTCEISNAAAELLAIENIEMSPDRGSPKQAGDVCFPKPKDKVNEIGMNPAFCESTDGEVFKGPKTPVDNSFPSFEESFISRTHEEEDTMQHRNDVYVDDITQEWSVDCYSFQDA